MTRIPSSMKSATRLLLVATILLLAFGTLSFAQGYRYTSDEAWSFGVMGDTQWTLGFPGAPNDPEGVNPDCVSAGIVQKLNDQFIGKGVRFVIQLGDLSNWAGDAAMYSRANAAQPLLNKGIGFFPVRGNHETYGYFFDDLDHTMNIPAFRDAFPQTQGLSNTFGTKNFTGPDIDALKGLSYSFDYGDQGNNARFVFVDTEATSYYLVEPTPHPIYGQGYDYPSVLPTWVLYKYTEPLLDNNPNVPAGTMIEPGNWFRIDSSGLPSTDWHGWDAIWPLDDFTVLQQPKWVSTGTEYYPGKQQTWISDRLDVTKVGRPEHAFVLTHRGPMNQNHVDSMFGSSPGSKSADQNIFYKSLQDNGVKYMLGAHDHLHNRALVKSPDGKSKIETLIATGASTKFYTPLDPSAFIGVYGDVKQRETQISQELYNIGYYIYTVDGPRVLVDYYSDSTGNFQDDANFPYGDASVPAPLYTPQFNFVKKESWGYSLNGKQFVVPQGTPFDVVKDSFDGTTAEVIAGVNSSTTVDGSPTTPRPLSKTVNTGWVPKPPRDKTIVSNILSLWGMGELGMDSTDVYVLEMSYVDRRVKGKGRENGNAGIRLSSLDANGHWVNAVQLNVGVKNARDQKFIKGPWKPGYKLGTYGIDMNKGTVWAVINYNADFAATQ